MIMSPNNNNKRTLSENNIRQHTADNLQNEKSRDHDVSRDQASENDRKRVCRLSPAESRLSRSPPTMRLSPQTNGHSPPAKETGWFTLMSFLIIYKLFYPKLRCFCSDTYRLVMYLRLDSQLFLVFTIN